VVRATHQVGNIGSLSGKYTTAIQRLRADAPVKETEHIAACLVLALHYTGVELLRLLQKWHYDRQGCSCTP
jgi:hypothetical protein